MRTEKSCFKRMTFSRRHATLNRSHAPRSIAFNKQENFILNEVEHLVLLPILNAICLGIAWALGTKHK